MITPLQFKQDWERVAGDCLVSFPESSLSDVLVPAEVRVFLAEAGLPCEAAPFLDFEPPKSGTLERVSVVWHQPSAFDRYRIIGGNGSGDPVCLDEGTGGQIVYLNHDKDFQRVLMASSVFTLAECLVQLRDIIIEAGGDTERISPGRLEALLGGFRIIDPAASGEGGFWHQEFRSLLPAGAKTWWQFWK